MAVTHACPVFPLLGCSHNSEVEIASSSPRALAALTTGHSHEAYWVLSPWGTSGPGPGVPLALNPGISRRVPPCPEPSVRALKS